METENEKLGNEPAFPAENLEQYSYLDMSKRFYAACMAMQGILTGIRLTNSIAPDSERIVKDAYRISDELLKQENL